MELRDSVQRVAEARKVHVHKPIREADGRWCAMSKDAERQNGHFGDKLLDEDEEDK